MKDAEHLEQRALFTWAGLMKKHYKELALMYAIPNGGDRHPGTARKLKAEGVKAGVPDVCLPVSRGPYHALYIEMKRPEVKVMGQDKGRTSAVQQKWITGLTNAGNAVVVCYGFEQAKRIIIDYLTREGEIGTAE